MESLSFADIPPEILSEIFSFLDPKTILLCCSVCSIWHDTIVGSPQLQCTIELCAEGLVAGDVGALTPSDTLRAIHQRRLAWHNLEYTSRTVVKVDSLETCRAYELVGGVFAQQEHGLDFCAISLAHIADMDEARTKHALAIDVEDFQDFAMDPTQDLVVFLYHVDAESANLECRTLASHQAHPLASLPLLSLPLARDPSMTLSIQIADDVVALSFPDQNRLLLWNWRKGIMLQDASRMQSPLYIADFEFLSSRSFILAFPSNSGRIEVYTFEGDCRDSTTHVATLRLPDLVPDRIIRGLGIHSGPLCARPMPGRPFSTSNERRIYVFLMDYDNLKWKRLFVHYRTLQQYVIDYEMEKWLDPADVPWDEWGPQNSRILPGTYYGWLRHVEGERIVIPNHENQCIEVLDFGIIRSRPPSLDALQAAGVSDTELHMHPTTLSEENDVFAEAVTTSLPFRSTLRSMGDFNVFLIDQDHIIAANPNVENEITVFTF
ncbi:hypothetical protein B0H11DRAFT_2078366 [Mycena galericulata]|nr:hypothetical protein B0H11DRAFT_2078366 [Mycena galericulata]